MKRTPTGIAILQMAENIAKENKSLSANEAIAKAKEYIKSKKSDSSVKTDKKENFKSGLLRSVVGSKVSDHILKERNEISEPLEAPKVQKQELPSELKEIIKKLSLIEVDIKTIKSERLAVKTKKTVKKTSEKESSDMKHAKAALKNMGFKREEISSMVQGAPKDGAIQDIIKHALKPKAIRIPKEEVIPAIDKAIKETSPQLEPQESPKASETSPQLEPQESPKVSVAPKEEKTFVAPKVSVAPKEEKTFVGEQKEATGIRTEENKKETEKERKAFHKNTIKELHKLRKEVEKKSKHSESFIDSFINALGKDLLGNLLKTLGGFLMESLLPVVAVAGAAFLGFELGKWINKHFHLSSKIGGLFAHLFGVDGSSKATSTYSSTQMKIKENAKLKGTGYTWVAPGKFKSPTGKTVVAKDLPNKVKQKIGMYVNTTKNKPKVQPHNTKTQQAAKTIKKTVEVAHQADKTAKATDRIERANEEKASTAEPKQVTKVVVAPTKEKMVPVPVPQQNEDDKFVMVQVRNGESTLAKYTNSIFNSPGSFSGLIGL